MTTFEDEHEQATDKALVRRVTKKLLPFLFLLYVVAYLDRVNVSFAKLHMNTLPWFSESIYGFGAGVFFLGYFLFEVPSNMLLQRFGARRWIARIMFTWGIIAMGMMFVNGKWTFYTVRFLLGLAEAGFFPGVILYLTYWFTARERAGLVATFMTANVVCYSLGGPISGYILGLKGLWRLAGWQWLFLLEGIPAVLLGFAVLAYLPDGPGNAKWLSDTDFARITMRLQAEEDQSTHKRHESLGPALRNPTVWLFCGIYLALVTGMYGISLWLPQIIKNFKGVSDVAVGFLTAIPYIIAGFGMVLNGAHSDRTQERRWHIALPAIIGALGLIVLAFTLKTPVVALIAVCFVATGLWATLGPFWSLPPSRLRGVAAAGGIAIVNSIGNLGGYFGPSIVGKIVSSHAGYRGGILFLATSILIGAALALAVPRDRFRSSMQTSVVEAPAAT